MYVNLRMSNIIESDGGMAQGATRTKITLKKRKIEKGIKNENFKTSYVLCSVKWLSSGTGAGWMGNVIV